MDPSGLVYLQARYYDPELGRFLSTDPVDPDPQTGTNFNRYAYAENNPYSKYDPSGRESRDFEHEYKLSGAEPPPPSPDDWLGPAIGVALGAVMAPVVAAGAVEAGTAALTNPEAATAIVNAVAEVGAGDALGGTALTAGAASQTFEILDGVRRAKAADMIGNTTIPAEVLNSEGRIASRQDVWTSPGAVGTSVL
jgi:RHS repeat-associated protein